MVLDISSALEYQVHGIYLGSAMAMKMNVLDLLHIRNIVLNGLKLMPAGEDTITSKVCMNHGIILNIRLKTHVNF